MRKLIQLVIKYRKVAVTTVFVDPIVTEEWTLLSLFKIKILK